MDDKTKLYSEIERYEIINVNDGEKYSSLSNHDIIVDENGNMKTLIINESNSGISLFSKSEFLEIPFEFVKKIGTKTIIVDVDREQLSKTHL